MRTSNDFSVGQERALLHLTAAELAFLNLTKPSDDSATMVNDALDLKKVETCRHSETGAKGER